MSRARGRSSTTTRGRSASSSRGAKHKIAGQEMSWEYDPDTELSTQPDETFPDMKDEFPIPDPPTAKERRMARYHITIRNRIHNGPLHTVLSDNARVRKTGQRKSAQPFDPFKDMPTYADKYKPKARELPDFSPRTRTYPYKYFPEELRHVLKQSKQQDQQDQPSLAVKRGSKRKQGRTHVLEENAGNEDEDDQAEEGQQEEVRERDEDEEPEEIEPDPDETFEDDDDDMAGDYNAEAYFSGGEGDGDSIGGMDDDGGGADFD